MGVDANIPTGNLGAGEDIGVWIRQSLLQDDAPIKQSFDVRISGTTT